MIEYTSHFSTRLAGSLGMQWWNAAGSALNLGNSLDDRWLACLPLYHIGGLSILMRSVIYGISVMVHEKFDAMIINRGTLEDKRTLISVVAGMLRGIPVLQIYGLTQSCSQAVTLSPADAVRKLGSVGRPLAPVQLRIMCDNRQAPPGEPGEIFLKGPTITPGYVDRPEATARAFQARLLQTPER